MTDMDRARELIEKYLDEVIDKVELAELELLIVSDPEVAKEFARCARTDGFVYFHFNEATAQNALQLERNPERTFIETERPARRPWGLLERLVGPTSRSRIPHGRREGLYSSEKARTGFFARSKACSARTWL